MFSLYMNLIKLLKYGDMETTTKFFGLKSTPGIEDNYSFTLVIYLFSSVSLQLQRTKRKLSSFIAKKMLIETEFKEA